MSDIGDMMGLGLKIAAAFAAAATIAVGAAGFAGYRYMQNEKAAEALATRAEDTLKRDSLTVITMDKFKKTEGGLCDATRPYTAHFVAKDANGKVVEGTICSAPDRESTVTFKP